MIVIASHDNVGYLTRILDSLLRCTFNGHDILVVDTNSTNAEYLAAWPALSGRYPSVLFVRRSISCYEAGAFIYAMQQFPRDRYICIQDSIEITNPDFIAAVDTQLNYTDVVGFVNFPFEVNIPAYRHQQVVGTYIQVDDETLQQYDSVEQKERAEAGLGEFVTFPDNGIFGNMFAVNRTVVEQIPPEWLSEPRDKQGSCMWERRWALIFHQIGATVSFLHHIKTMEEWNVFNSNLFQHHRWTYPQYFTKILGGRD